MLTAAAFLAYPDTSCRSAIAPLTLAAPVLSSPQCIHHLIHYCLEKFRFEVKRKRTGSFRLSS